MKVVAGQRIFSRLGSGCKSRRSAREVLGWPLRDALNEAGVSSWKATPQLSRA